MGNAYDYSLILNQQRPDNVFIPSVPVVARVRDVWVHKLMINDANYYVFIEMKTIRARELLSLRYAYINYAEGVNIHMDIENWGNGIYRKRIYVQNHSYTQYTRIELANTKHINKIMQNIEKAIQ